MRIGVDTGGTFTDCSATRRPAGATVSSISAGEYLYEFSVWIVSPASNATASSNAAIRTVCATALSRWISTRPSFSSYRAR